MLLNDKILFDVTGLKFSPPEPNRAQILWFGMIYAQKFHFPMPIHLNYTWFHYSLYMMCLSLIMGYSDGLEHHTCTYI
jgi:hypothetical protein